MNIIQSYSGYTPNVLNPTVSVSAKNGTNVNKKNATLFSDNTAYLSRAKSGTYTDDFSVSFCFKIEAEGKTYTLFQATNSGSPSISFFAGTLDNITSQLILYLYGSTQGYLRYNCDTNLTAGTWYYGTVVYSNNDLTVYLNGANETYSSGDYSYGGGTFDGTVKSYNTIIVGKGNSNPNYIALDNYNIHDRIVTESEHIELYDNDNILDYSDFTSGLLTDLYSSYDFNEISSTRFDLHNSNDLTENGTVDITLGKKQSNPSNGDYIYSLSDLSGNSNDIIQLLGASQTIYNSGGYFTFDGVNDFMYLDGISVTEFTFYAVFEMSASGSFDTIFGLGDTVSTTPTFYLYRNSSGNLSCNDGTTAINSSTAVVSGTKYITITRVKNTSTYHSTIINGSSVSFGSDISGANTLTDRLTLGSTSFGSHLFVGKMYAAGLIPSAITDEQRTTLNNYLNVIHSVY